MDNNRPPIVRLPPTLKCMSDVDKLQEAEEWAGQQEQEEKAEQARLEAEELADEPISPTATREWRLESIPLAQIAERDPLRLELPKVHQLAVSIRQTGLNTPLTVRPDDVDKDQYVVVTGHRRLAALRELYPGDEADTAMIPCKIMVGLDEDEIFALALIENEQREDLDQLQAARAARHLLDLRPELSAADVAKMLGVTAGRLTNWLKLLDLPDTVQEHLEKGDLTFTVANMLRRAQEKGTVDELESAHLAQQIAQGDRTYKDVKAQIAPSKPKTPGIDSTLAPRTLVTNGEAVLISVEGGNDNPFDNEGTAKKDTWDRTIWEAEEQKAQAARSDYLEAEADRLMREAPAGLTGSLPTARPAAGEYIDTVAVPDNGGFDAAADLDGDETTPTISPVRDQLHAKMFGRMLHDWAPDDYLESHGIDRDDAMRYSRDLPYAKRVYMFYNLAAIVGSQDVEVE